MLRCRIYAREELRFCSTLNNDMRVSPHAVDVRLLNISSRAPSAGELPAVYAGLFCGTSELILAIFYSMSLRCCSSLIYMFELLRCDCCR